MCIPRRLRGNVGNPSGIAAQMGLLCTEITGNVYVTTPNGSDPDIACETAANVTGANTDALGAYNAANLVPYCVLNLNAGILSGITLASGTYKWTSAVTIPTDIYLNAQGARAPAGSSRSPAPSARPPA